MFELRRLEQRMDLPPYLSAHTRQTSELEDRVVHIGPAWPELAEIHKYTSVPQRAQKLLRAVGKRTRADEKAINDAQFDTRQYPHLVWTDAKDLRAKLTDCIQSLLAPNAGPRAAGA